MATVKILLVGGGAGGGDMGGGGAGGVVYNASYTVSKQNYSVGVGNGGAKFYQQPYGFNLRGYNGESTTFAGLLAYGGGGGGSYSSSGGGAGVGANGGSGGGGAIISGNFGQDGGNSIGGQGNSGGAGSYQGTYHLALGGGGGGAGAIGGSGYGTNNGGIGVQYDISGTLTYYAGGGGGVNGTSGGQGGGGVQNVDGTANTGGGGGSAANGGSGIVIISYRRGGLDGISETSTGGQEIITSTHKIHIFTTNLTWNCVLSINETFSVSVGAFTLTGVDTLLSKAKARLITLVGAFTITGISQNITAFVRRKNQDKNNITWKNQDKS